MTTSDTMPSLDDVLHTAETAISVLMHRAFFPADGDDTTLDGVNIDWVQAALRYCTPSDGAIQVMQEESVAHGALSMSRFKNILTDQVTRDMASRLREMVRAARQYTTCAAESGASHHDVWKHMSTVPETLLRRGKHGYRDETVRFGGAITFSLLLAHSSALPAIAHMASHVTVNGASSIMTQQFYLLVALHQSLAAHAGQDIPWAWREPLVVQSILEHLHDPVYGAHARTLSDQFTKSASHHSCI